MQFFLDRYLYSRCLETVFRNDAIAENHDVYCLFYD